LQEFPMFRSSITLSARTLVLALAWSACPWNTGLAAEPKAGQTPEKQEKAPQAAKITKADLVGEWVAHPKSERILGPKEKGKDTWVLLGLGADGKAAFGAIVGRHGMDYVLNGTWKLDGDSVVITPEDKDEDPATLRLLPSPKGTLKIEMEHEKGAKTAVKLHRATPKEKERFFGGDEPAVQEKD
jgi:hypothetical protein